MRQTIKLRPPWIVALVVFISMAASMHAQVTNTLFFMQGVPQSNRVNPAYQPEGNIYIGIPFLAPVRTSVSSGALAWEDVVYHNPMQSDSLITFLHPLGNKEAFMDKLKPLNLVTSDLGSALISAGFRTEVGYFSMDVVSRWDGNIYLPGDLARLLITGAKEGKVYDLNGVGADLMAFDE